MRDFFHEQEHTRVFAEAYKSVRRNRKRAEDVAHGKRTICERKLVDFTLRSLKRIQLPVSLFTCSLHMRGHVASPYTPLGYRIGKDEAVFAGGEILDFLATFTLLYNRMAVAAIKLAAFIAHEKAIHTLFYACTNHFNHILSLEV